MADSPSLSALQTVELGRATGSCWSLLWHMWGSTGWKGLLAWLAAATAQPFCSMVWAPHLQAGPSTPVVMVLSHNITSSLWLHFRPVQPQLPSPSALV